MKEEWKPVVGYEGLYEASNFGRVKSLDRYRRNNRGAYMRRGQILKLALRKVGKKGRYKCYSINLSRPGVCKTYRVHRLVAVAFIPNPNNLPEVNHKDENPRNNHVSNLEWCTHRYNMQYGTWAEKLSKKLLKHNHRSRAVARIDNNGRIIRVFNSVRGAARSLKCCYMGILQVCYGNQTHHHGMKFRYLENNDVR